MGEFGTCPRMHCNSQHVLPVGMRDDPRNDTVKARRARAAGGGGGGARARARASASEKRERRREGERRFAAPRHRAREG